MSMTYPPDPRMMAEDAKPERVHRFALIVVILGMLAIVGLAVIPGVRLKLTDKAFLLVHPNDTADRVIELMGEPDTGSGALPELERYWGDETNPMVRRDDIRKVLTWRVRVFFTAATWQVGFDAGGHAVCKHRYE